MPGQRFQPGRASKVASAAPPKYRTLQSSIVHIASQRTETRRRRCLTNKSSSLNVLFGQCSRRRSQHRVLGLIAMILYSIPPLRPHRPREADRSM